MKARWDDQRRYLPLLGRIGDVVDFATLPPRAQPAEIAEIVGSFGAYDDDGSEACGSPGEVASEPLLSHRYRSYLADDVRGMEAVVVPYNGNNGHAMVWTTVVLQAADQLRQRVAWSLSQILVIGEEGLGKSDENEIWHSYFDILVRHAFGSYRDLLGEVSYSPTMAEYLSFHNNLAYAVRGTNPDENYAREIMQVRHRGTALLRTAAPPCCLQATRSLAHRRDPTPPAALHNRAMGAGAQRRAAPRRER